ncbi:UDP-N-acetylglucosamine--peptide N-acetylglucosaminyltransferase 110 kDa subunit-like [Artemia franciscana]|uniref:UDP-N-acetylglucosamine--peptide N-acetylglucosaminyltransferase 110 kDa subunit-like n=1 Tax=Artemia franciscana TaxID=6661 RepID=UPI0032D9F87F
MFPHMKERVVIQDREKLSSNLPAIADNVAVINGTDLSPLYERTDVRRVTETISSSTTTTFEAPVVGSLTVAQLPTMQPIETMIVAGQIQTSVNGVVVQNGLATPQAHTRAATGEEVPQNIVVTTRQQYGLPDASVVYCNFNQLYKIDPATLKMWVNVAMPVQETGNPIARDFGSPSGQTATPAQETGIPMTKHLITFL